MTSSAVPPARQVLWTGGLDSTYRVLHLALVEQRTVQPIYVIDPERGSADVELATMARIRAAVEERGAGDRLLPTQVLERGDYPVDDDLQQAFDRLLARVHVGSQMLWLANIARAEGWTDVDLGMHAWTETPEFTATVFDGLGTGAPTVVDPDAQILFFAWSFPLLHITKPEMLEHARSAGFLDILSMRWFCFRPVRGKPCGLCNPCKQAASEGVVQGIGFPSGPVLAWRRLSRRGRRRLRGLRRRLRSSGG